MNKQLTIEEGNFLIAKFIGYTYPNINDRVWEISKRELHDYDQDWRKLMSVIEKIEHDGCEVSISSQIEWINDDQDTVYHQDVCICRDFDYRVETTSLSKIQSVWQAVVQFIQLHNVEQNDKGSNTTGSDSSNVA